MRVWDKLHTPAKLIKSPVEKIDDCADRPNFC